MTERTLTWHTAVAALRGAALLVVLPLAALGALDARTVVALLGLAHPDLKQCELLLNRPPPSLSPPSAQTEQ